jgi:glycosyltransferase involved in cell wall biosynthesis
MRIRYLGGSVLRPRGGGEISAATLLERLAREHQVEVLGASDRAATSEQTWGSVEDLRTDRIPTALPVPYQLRALCEEIEFARQLTLRLRGNPPLVILQHPAAIALRNAEGSKVVTFIRSQACFGIGDPEPSGVKRWLGLPFQKLRSLKNRTLLERSNLIITNSRYLQSQLHAATGLASSVIHPFIKLPKTGTPSSGQEIGFTGLNAWKGGTVALDIARAHPERSFAFLEGSRAKPSLVDHARRLPNVTVLPWTDDIEPFCRRIRLLLVPSLWEEPFGRLPIEVGVHGIPTLASASGGLSEAVGEGGLCIAPRDDVASWSRAIEALDDDVHYAQLSKRAIAHAAEVSFEVTYQQFVDLVAEKLGLRLG